MTPTTFNAVPSIRCSLASGLGAPSSSSRCNAFAAFAARATSSGPVGAEPADTPARPSAIGSLASITFTLPVPPVSSVTSPYPRPSMMRVPFGRSADRSTSEASRWTFGTRSPRTASPFFPSGIQDMLGQ